MKYIVTDPNGVLHNGERIDRGQSLPASVSCSQLTAWKRFGQVKEVKPKPEPEKPPAGGNTSTSKPPEGGDKIGGDSTASK